MKKILIAGMMLLSLSGYSSSKTKSQDRPNILFCIADDASYPYMSAYGCSWINTPGFDRVAKEGVLFTNAYTPNAKCAPSRAAILTGRNSWQLEEAGNHNCNFPKKFKTYVEELNDNGYFVGKTGKGWAPGNPGMINGKRRELAGKAYQSERAERPTSGINNLNYSSNFTKFLKDVPQDSPWCFWYGGTEPHRKYEYGSGIKKGGKALSDIDVVPAFWPDNDTVRTDMLDYAYEVEHFDKHLKSMIEHLEKIGQLENTIIVVTSDNGMPFPRCKAQEYEMSNHMPFAIMWPKGIKNPGRVVNDYVSFIDIAPTFLEIAGISTDNMNMQPVTGKSLTPIFNSTKEGRVVAERDFVLIGRERHDCGRPENQGYPIRGIIQDGTLYLNNMKPHLWPAADPETGYLDCDGSPTKTYILNQRRAGKDDTYWQLAFGKRSGEELYDLKKDFFCVDNKVADKAYDNLKNQLKDRLFKLLEKQGDPRVVGNGDVFDGYPYARKQLWNFYEKYMSGDRSVKTGWVNKSDYEEKPIKQ
ncbi:heparan N-sulfatase [Puteibacter caeruleilacunae]|nr:heparan N-sulfatase [Puteibacter caeruleilacunae]